MARKSPAFSFYPDSWFGGTLLMTAEQKAAYIDLLSAQWVNGSLTRQQAHLVCRGVPDHVVDFVLDSKFTDVGNGLFKNERLEQERGKQQARKAAGSKGGHEKHKKKSESPKQIASEPDSKTPSKDVSKKLHSDSDSVSDSVLVSETDSDSKNKTSSLSTGSTVSVDEFFERWNRFAAKTAKMTQCRKLTTERRRKISIRLKENGWFEDFREAVLSLPLGGDGWQPTLDWLIENGHNAYRLLEGDFDWRNRDDPAAIRLAEQRRKNAYEERLEREKCQKQQTKAASSGLHKVIENILPQTSGRHEAASDESLLFGRDESLSVSGASTNSP